MIEQVYRILIAVGRWESMEHHIQGCLSYTCVFIRVVYILKAKVWEYASYS